MKKIPVILDTDIGCDIDDAWALAMLLNSPELDLKMVLTGTGDVEYRAGNAGKMLESAGRSDVLLGLGRDTDDPIKSVEEWVEGYSLNDYPGCVVQDGVEKACELIRQSEMPVTVIGIGPMTNLAAMLECDPDIVKNSKVVAMCGSISKGLEGSKGRIAEWNVKQDIAAAEKVFSSDWDLTITPLDTCGVVRLDGELYSKVKQSDKPLAIGLLEQFKIWDEKYSHGFFEKSSSTLFDTVAVYLAYSDKDILIRDLPIRISDEGMMEMDEAAKLIHCALEWESLEYYKKHLVERVC